MEKEINYVSSFNSKKEIIYSLGVYELRGLARVLGVKSPTTKRREELISQIMEIVGNNEDFALREIEKRGRPFKALSSVNSIINAISTSSDEEKKNSFKRFSTYEEIIVFNQEMPAIKMQSSDIFPSSGVLRKGPVFGYYVDCASQKTVFIAPEQMQKYELATGDYVDCAVFEINNGDKCFVKKINKINGINAEEYNLKTFNDYTQDLPSIQNINEKNILIGGRNVLLSKTTFYSNDYLKNIFSCFKDCKKIFLGVNLCFEDKSFVSKQQDVFAFTSNYNEILTNGYDRIIDVINLVERLRDLNEDVFLLVGDLSNVLNVLDSYFINDDAQILGHKEKTIVIAKRLIALAMSKSNGRKITSLFVCNSLDLDDAFIKNELLKISNIIE